MSVSIVIPVYNALEFARECVESVYRARTSIPFEVIAVDNGSSEDVREWLAQEAARRANFRAVRFNEPLGFPRAVNEGARLARHDLLVLLNTDTVVYEGWLDGLASALDADVAVAGPVTNHCGHDAQTEPGTDDLSKARDFAASIGARTPLKEPQRLVFFCAMIRRSVWLELGGLDEAYSPGNFEDDDFCLRARLAGYRLSVARSVFVYHHASRTFQANRVGHGEALARNHILFCDRAAAWSKRPAADVRRRVIADLAVIVPVPPGWGGLGDSLASLANQTVTGFKIIVKQGAGTLPALLNEGIAEARGLRIAFLPAGDIFFPFHLEVLAGASAEAAYTAWSVRDGEQTGVVRFDQASPQRLHTGDWAPLVSWMHTDPPLFDESLDAFCCWDWVMRLKTRPHYLPRVTCQKAARASSGEEARRVMDAHPVSGEWREHERRRFLTAVRQGSWERQLLIEGNPVERRARRMLASTKLALNVGELELAAARFRSVPIPDRQAKRAVILFSIIHWTDLVQRPHHFARGLAARGIPVYWVDVRLKAPELMHGANLTTEIEPGLHYLELPCAAGDLYQLDAWHPAVLDAMEAAFGALPISDAVQLVNFPKWTPLVQRLHQRFGWPIVYDCLDDQQAFGAMYAGNEPALEQTLLREAEVVVTSGRTLYQRLVAQRPDTVFISNAADFELFGSARSAGLLDHLRRPIVGFFGALSDWLDLDWIRESARRFPDWSFVYIGRDGFSSRETRERWMQATSAENVHRIGQQDPQTLATYLAQFDVCTMPFLDMPITRSMNAVKIFEYLAAGKPVIARDLPETRPLADLGLIEIYDTNEASFDLLARAVAQGADEEQIKKRRAFAAENTWNHRMGQLISALQRVKPAPRPF